MKVSVLQSNLIKGLNTANRSVASRAQLPVLSNVLLTTDKGRLKISATNLETGVNLWVGAKVAKSGSISVPARILTEFVDNLPEGSVDLELKGNNLSLSCGHYQADFICLPATEFPVVPSLTDKTDAVFETSDLSEAISQTAFAAAADEGRPVLTGVFLIAKDQSLMMVATDGYRLSLKKVAVSSQKTLSFLSKGLVIPAKALSEVSRVVKDAGEKKLKLSATSEANQIIFGLGDVEIISRLIEGDFPDYEKIIPEKSNSKVVLDKQELFRAVKMAAIFSRESANIVKFQVKGSKLRISANTAQVGSNVSEMGVKGKLGETQIAFNSRYLLDFLSMVDGDEVVFETSGALNPGVFSINKDNSLLHIIMPVRVQD